MNKHIIIVMTFLYCGYHFELCAYSYLKDDARLNEVLLGSAHNSPYSTAYGWLYAQQHGTVEQQWAAGMRSAEIKLHWRYEVSTVTQLAEKAGDTQVGGAIKSGFNKVTSVFGKKSQPQEEKPYIGLCHEGDKASNCFVSATLEKADNKIMSLTEYFKKITALIEKNPKDVAVFFLADEGVKTLSKLNRAAGKTDQQLRSEYHQALVDSGIGKYTWVIDPAVQQPWPTIGEMRRLNKRVVIFSEENLRVPQDTVLSSQSGLFKFTGSDDVFGELARGECKLSGRSAQNASALYVSFSAEMSINKKSTKADIISKLPVTKTKSIDLTPIDYTELNSLSNLKKRVAICEEKNVPLKAMILSLDFMEEGSLAQAVKEINEQRGVAVKA